MVKTRSKRSKNLTRKQILRDRVKHSSCRGHLRSVCIKKKKCKNTKAAIRRSYCRKSKNRRV